jgi:FADH2 O2-dependent halogenase
MAGLDHDVVVLGSGIAGSTLALVLRRAGCRVLVVEKHSHPRFAIGESSVPTTQLGFELLSRRYDVPELRELFHYVGLKKRGLAGYTKTNFWFGLHRPDRPLAERAELMFETAPLPRGPDVHLFRQDVDAFLVSLFPSYGVEYLDRTELTDYDWNGREAALSLKTAERTVRVRAKLVVDATGPGSLLARRHGLLAAEPGLATRSRAVYTHAEGVPPLEDVLGSRNPAFVFRRDAGTMHHCFDGGWSWTIPFDNGLTSVGFVLDLDRHPEAGTAPEDEVRRILDRHPTMRAHLGGMKPARAWISSRRHQYRANSILGPGFVLAPHAAGFVDPLFSTGFNLTQSFIHRFVPVVERCMKDGDFSRARFEPLESAFFRELSLADRIVSSVFRSFVDYDVLKQAWRLWIHGSILQYCLQDSACAAASDEVPELFGAGNPGFEALVSKAHAVAGGARAEPGAAAAELKRLIDDACGPVGESDFALASEKACLVGYPFIGADYGGWLARHAGQPAPQVGSGWDRIVRLEELRRAEIAEWSGTTLRDVADRLGMPAARVF